MKLIHFKAEKVNGYLDFDIKFDESLTFLIGINGSGKTTAIKLLLGLVSPSWINLTQIKYSFAEVECKLGDESLKIRSEYQDSDKIKLSLTYPNNEEKNATSTVKVQDLPTIEVSDFSRFELRQIMTRYSRYESHFTELDAVKQIREMITPVFLGLDRRIHEGNEIDLINMESFFRQRDITTNIKGNLYESLLDVENLIKNSFLEYSQKQSAVSAALKNKIIYASFDIIQGGDESGLNLQTNIDIKTRRERIIEASKNFEIPDLESKILNYFDELARIQARLSKLQKVVDKKKNQPHPDFIKALGQWFINSPQLERIDNIISLYEDAQNEIVNEYKLFTKFETLANQFFSENSKKLIIKKNGEIEIELPNGDPSNIYRLSSGEKQIIVMLAQLIFGQKRFVFIIDEPELSLHLGWQEIFVKSIIDASPETQFVLATHSPTIVGHIENEKYCVDLTPKTK